MNSQSLVLASTSIYRSQLLSVLQIPFLTDSPNVDETPLPGEDAKQTSYRLSRLKAETVTARHPDALIIGSDQVALLDGEQLALPALVKHVDDFLVHVPSFSLSSGR